jgi:hypothetical protein
MPELARCIAAQLLRHVLPVQTGAYAEVMAVLVLLNGPPHAPEPLPQRRSTTMRRSTACPTTNSGLPSVVAMAG